MHYGLCGNGKLSIFAAYSALQIIRLFCGICQYGLGSFSIEKIYIYFRFYGDDCWLHQRSTSTINTIILGLNRVVFYDGSNWLITMRGEVGLQKESLQISDYLSSICLRSLSRLFFCYVCLLQIKAKGKP